MVFREFFVLATLLAIGLASERTNDPATKCTDNCTQSPEERVEEFQVNVSQQQLPLGLQSMFNGLLSNDFFRDVDDRHRHGGLTLSFGMPNEGQVNFLGVPQWVNKHVGSMMQQMNKQMGQMMQSMRSGMMSGAGAGKMYVMKSGPGYHEEKTYDIGPNGEMKLIENDEMEKVNRLDEHFNQEDVQVFDPEMLMNEFEQQMTIDDTKEKNDPAEEWIKELDEQLANHVVNDLEGPKLPETGLRSRPKNSMCRMDDLDWSNWSRCLHLGMPKWLVISSLCLGIIFLLWLCLVIPSNAPRQRVKKIPEISAKEAEAFAIMTTNGQKPPLYPNDLPPAYEDVAKVKVALEPTTKTKNEEA